MQNFSKFSKTFKNYNLFNEQKQGQECNLRFEQYWMGPGNAISNWERSKPQTLDKLVVIKDKESAFDWLHYIRQPTRTSSSQVVTKEMKAFESFAFP